MINSKFIKMLRIKKIYNFCVPFCFLFVFSCNVSNKEIEVDLTVQNKTEVLEKVHKTNKEFQISSIKTKKLKKIIDKSEKNNENNNEIYKIPYSSSRITKRDSPKGVAKRNA